MAKAKKARKLSDLTDADLAAWAAGLPSVEEEAEPNVAIEKPTVEVEPIPDFARAIAKGSPHFEEGKEFLVDFAPAIGKLRVRTWKGDFTYRSEAEAIADGWLLLTSAQVTAIAAKELAEALKAAERLAWKEHRNAFPVGLTMTSKNLIQGQPATLLFRENSIVLIEGEKETIVEPTLVKRAWEFWGQSKIELVLQVGRYGFDVSPIQYTSWMGRKEIIGFNDSTCGDVGIGAGSHALTD